MQANSSFSTHNFPLFRQIKNWLTICLIERRTESAAVLPDLKLVEAGYREWEKKRHAKQLDRCFTSTNRKSLSVSKECLRKPTAA